MGSQSSGLIHYIGGRNLKKEKTANFLARAERMTREPPTTLSDRIVTVGSRPQPRCTDKGKTDKPSSEHTVHPSAEVMKKRLFASSSVQRAVYLGVDPIRPQTKTDTL